MGIRFFCEHCERKLNVKEFLGGKRGICPHCGGGIDIPAKSKINRDGTPVDSTESAEAAEPTTANPMAEATQSVAIQTQTPAEDPQPTPTPAATPDNTPATVNQPMEPIAAAPVPATPTPVPASQPPSDAIAEAPDAVWYVRPPSGGQYGPAAGDTMKKWLDQGRVGFDSLVWREGWPDWKQAGEVFPQITPSSVSPSSQSVPAMTADQREPNFAANTAASIPNPQPSITAATDELPSSRFRQAGIPTSWGLIILVAFAAIGLILIGGFMWFIWATQANNANQNGATLWSAVKRPNTTRSRQSPPQFAIFSQRQPDRPAVLAAGICFEIPA